MTGLKVIHNISFGKRLDKNAVLFFFTTVEIFLSEFTDKCGDLLRQIGS